MQVELRHEVSKPNSGAMNLASQYPSLFYVDGYYSIH